MGVNSWSTTKDQCKFTGWVGKQTDQKEVGITDGIETTDKVIQQTTRAWTDRNDENQMPGAPWGNIGSMGIRVDSEWWCPRWVSEDTEVVENLAYENG